MKKFVSIFAVLVLLLFNTFPVSASEYLANPFYAIKSYPEYEKTLNTLRDSNHMYYGWSRIVRDSNGYMVFTNKKGRISSYDYFTEYYLPDAINGKLPNEIHKSGHPDSKNLLMVFFSNMSYDDGRNSAVDFLNMSSTDWDKKIITPMVEMVVKYGFDGVVLDFEGFINNHAGAGYTDFQKNNLKEKYKNFLEQLRGSLKDKVFTVCVNVPGYYDGYDYSSIYDIADYMILLAYPFGHFERYQESDGVPALTGKIKSVDIPEAQPYDKAKAELDNLIGILKQRYTEEFNPKKLILGATIEINGWIQKELVYNSKTYTYYEGIRSLPDGNKFKAGNLSDLDLIEGTVDYIAESVLYKYKSKTYRKVVDKNLEPRVRKIEYYYETPESIYDKFYTMVKGYNLSGISIWRMGLGNTGIWSSINSIFDVPEGSYEELPPKVDVPVDKAWTVKFNMAVNRDTIKQSLTNIAVVDSQGNLITLKFQYDEASNSVKVIPAADYKPGEVYFLIVGKGMASLSEGNLEKPVRMKFKIKY